MLCATCRSELTPAPDRILEGGVRVVGAFEHRGPARKLIHDVKYRGVTGYLRLVTAMLGDKVPTLPLAPVPRSLTRRLEYGVDPALLLAQGLASEKGTEVWTGLQAPIHTIRRAGARRRLPVTRFRLNAQAQDPVLLVDDVLTTGATLEAAMRSLGPGKVRGAVVANVVPEVSSLLRRSVPNKRVPSRWHPS